MNHFPIPCSSPDSISSCDWDNSTRVQYSTDLTSEIHTLEIYMPLVWYNPIGNFFLFYHIWNIFELKTAKVARNRRKLAKCRKNDTACVGSPRSLPSKF